MRLRPSPRLATGALTLAIWALAAGSALFWVLRSGEMGLPASAAVAGGSAGVAVDTRTVARVLGAPEVSVVSAPPPEAEIASRLALRGVVTHGARGAALIAVDGKPARPVRVGGKLDGVDGWTVRAVEPRAVVVAAGERSARLEMPRLSERSSAGDAVASPRPMMPPPQVSPPATPAPSPAVPPQNMMLPQAPGIAPGMTIPQQPVR